MPLSVKGSKDGEGELESRRGRGSDGGKESPVENDDLDPTLEVIHIPFTKTTKGTNSTAASRLSYSPDGSRRQTDAQQQQQQQLETGDTTKDKTNKWKKLKTGLSRSTKLIGRRLKPGGGRSEKNVVEEICILPSNGLNGECFGEEKKEDGEKEKEKEEGGRKAKGGRKGRGGGGGKRRGGGLGGQQRSDSDDSLVFASRVDSATSSNSRSRLPTSVESSSNKKTVDESIVIYDADYDGQL